ncbi:hypothetical protein XU18_5238 [Perkinsela sp. CCAP 1560/4]|nr:hypothetical protein XU18_5238 [Perkinsela sp. CCAP 1560/4]|eukprot:KNH00561.1 hypothetical protein XU18_5238 [Perkinsela sp. CCAP 1560/4]
MIPFSVLLLHCQELKPQSLFDRKAAEDSQSIIGSAVGVEELSADKQCEAAIFQYTEMCPGFESIDIVASNTTNLEALRRFCPCVSHAARRSNYKLFHTMDKTCGRSFSASISYLSNIVCAMPESKLEYCGSKITEINDTFVEITKILNDSKNRLSAQNKQALQKRLGKLCDPCFEEVGAGLVRWLSEVHAAGRAHSPEPSEGQSEITTLIGKLLDGRILCVRNDNTTHVKNGDDFCVPWLLGEMLPLGARCMDVQPKHDEPATLAARKQCLKDDECVWYSGTACGSLIDHFTDTSTYAHLPPRAIHQSTAANRCFQTIQNVVQQNRVILADAVIPGRPTAGVYEDAQRSAGALEAVSAYGWLGDGASASSCLSRWRSSNFSTIKKRCSQEEIDSFQTGKVKCGPSCSAAWHELIDELGCCYGVVRQLQQALDPLNTMLPNFEAIEKACGVKSIKACDPFSGDSRDISVHIRGVRCEDLQRSNRKLVLDTIQQDVAYQLGIPKSSIQNLKVTQVDGTSCTSSSVGTKGELLKVKCTVRLSDASRLERIVNHCNDSTSPMFLPTVYFILEKDRELEKQMEILKDQRSVPFKQDVRKQYLPYKLWVISLCVIVLLLIAAIFIILMWREKITFVWCWSCRYFFRQKKPRDGRRSVAGSR